MPPSKTAKDVAIAAPGASVADVPVSIIAVGPSREQTIMRRWEPRP